MLKWFRNRKQKKELHSILENYSTIGCSIVVDIHFNIVYTNEYAQQLFGYTRKEFLQLTIHDLIPNHLVKTHRDHLKKYNIHADIVNEFMSLKKNVHGRKKSGIVFKTNVNLTNITIDNTPYILAIVQDLSSSNTFLENMRQYKLFFTQSTDLLCIVNKDGRFSEINPAFYETLGYEKKTS